MVIPKYVQTGVYQTKHKCSKHAQTYVSIPKYAQTSVYQIQPKCSKYVQTYVPIPYHTIPYNVCCRLSFSKSRVQNCSNKLGPVCLMSYNFSICLTQIEKCDKILHCLGAKVPLFKMSVVFMNIWLVSRSKNLALIHKPVFRSTVYSSHTERSYQISCLRYLQFNRKLISERSRTRNPSRFPQLWKTARNKLNKSYLGKLPKISRGGGAQNREAFGRKWVPPLSGATDYTPQV